MSEEFKKWWAPWGDMHLDKLGMKRMALDSWQARQTEIDALKAEVLKLSDYRDKYLWALEENGSLCAELELLRKEPSDFSTTTKEEWRGSEET